MYKSVYIVHIRSKKAPYCIKQFSLSLAASTRNGT